MSAELLEGQMPLFDVPAPAEKSEAPAAEPAVKDARKSTKKKAAPEPVTTARRAKEKTKKAPTRSSAKAVGPRGGRGLSGLVPEGDVRLTANMREDIHLKLKIAAARQRTTIGEILEELVEKYIK